MLILRRQPVVPFFLLDGIKRMPFRRLLRRWWNSLWERRNVIIRRLIHRDCLLREGNYVGHRDYLAGWNRTERTWCHKREKLPVGSRFLFSDANLTQTSRS